MREGTLVEIKFGKKHKQIKEKKLHSLFYRQIRLQTKILDLRCDTHIIDSFEKTCLVNHFPIEF